MTVLFDVSALVAHARPDHAAHDAAAASVRAVLRSGEPFMVPDPVVLGLVRVTTRTRAFRRPSTLRSAFAYLDALQGQPSFVRVAAGGTTLGRQAHLLRFVGSGPNEIVDTYLAALALEHSARLVSFDRGFARFPGLAWVDPSDPAALPILEG